MATTFSSTKCGSTYQARAGIDLTCSYCIYEVATQIVVNDVFQMVKIGAGQTVVEVICSVDDLDGGSASVHAVGDGAAAGRFITGSTDGQGGATSRLGAGITGSAAADCLAYAYTADDTIDIKFTTAPASTGTGTIALAVFHTGNS